MSEWLGGLLALLGAAILLTCGAATIIAWRNQRWQHGWLALLAGLSGFVLLEFDWIREFGYVVKTTPLLKELDRYDQKLEDVRLALEEVRAAQDEQRAQDKAQREELSDLQETVRATRIELGEQAAALHTVQEAVQGLVSSVVTEIFQPDDERLTVLPHGDRQASVFFELSRVPKPQTVQIFWDQVRQPDGSFGVHRNIIGLRWGATVEEAKARPLKVTYAPDPTRAREKTKMERTGGNVYVDGQQLDLWSGAIEAQKP